MRMSRLDRRRDLHFSRAAAVRHSPTLIAQVRGGLFWTSKRRIVAEDLMLTAAPSRPARKYARVCNHGSVPTTIGG
jgi:hypothetical protein